MAFSRPCQLPASVLQTGCDMQEKAEAKLKAFDAKADEQRRVREAADAQWRDMQRTRDLKRRQVHRLL